MNRFKIAQIIALVSTLVVIIGLCFATLAEASWGQGMFYIGILIGFVSYLFAGLLTALKMAGSIAKWGLVAAPFPINLFVVCVAFLFAVILFLFFPIIPIRKAYKESGLC